MATYFFLQVKLLSGWTSDLWYKISADNFKHLSSNVQKRFFFLEVFLRNNAYLAVVEKVQQEQPIFAKKIEIKEIIKPEFFVSDASYFEFISQASGLFGVPKFFLVKRLLPFFKSVKDSTFFLKSQEDELVDYKKKYEQEFNLNSEQRAAVSNILSRLDQFAPTLLQGVTGSGKTQVYLRIIFELLARKKTVFLLVPEVSLALNFYNFFRKFLPEKALFAWHSASTKKDQKIDLWQATIYDHPCLIIGVHLPIFLPTTNLGAIIVDEEHEESFLEQHSPYLNTKQLALLRASQLKIPIIFGSATPSFSTLTQSLTSPWQKESLNFRFRDQSLPEVITGKLGQNISHKSFWMTKKLKDFLTDRIQKKEQSILFLNRRGFSSIVRCKSCSEVFVCINCSVSLTLHKNENKEQQLLCHYCDFFEDFPVACKKCGNQENFIFKGLGTEQVCKILQEEFFDAKILRADAASIKKKDWSSKIAAFEQGEFDILVGTKSIAKGYHFPKVTFVCVLWADLDFYFPVYNAKEKAVQQLLQVAGRAGRGFLPGQVLIQAFDPNFCAQFVSEESYSEFVQQELVARKAFCYPPFCKLIFVEFKNEQELLAKKNGLNLKMALQDAFVKNNIQGQFFGPTAPAVSKQKSFFYFQLMIKIQSSAQAKKCLQILSQFKQKMTSNSFEFWLES